MAVLRAVVDTVVGLVVDDGLVVVGALAALIVTGLLSRFAPEVPDVLVGIVLFVLVAASLVASLLRAARDAHRHAIAVPGEPTWTD